MMQIHKKRNIDSVNAALQTLKALGLNIPPSPSHITLLQEHAKLWKTLEDRSIENLIDLPEMTDKQAKLKIDLIASILETTISTEPRLAALLTLHGANISLTYGTTDACCYLYVSLGIVLESLFKKISEGYQFGRLGYDLANKRKPIIYKPSATALFGTSINPWTHPLQSSLPFIKEAYDAAIQINDELRASYCCYHYVYFLLAQGDPLEEVYAKLQERLVLVREFQVHSAESLLAQIENLIVLLIRRSYEPLRFNNQGSETIQNLRKLQEHGLHFSVFTHHFRACQRSVIFSDYTTALKAGTRAKEFTWASTFFFERSEFYFYYALALSGSMKDLNPEQWNNSLELLVSYQEQFKLWAHHCTENFMSSYELISAEICRIKREDLDAEQHYQLAIRFANENKLLQNEALSYELSSNFYRARGFELIANTYLREANLCYRRWGAKSKVQQLEKTFPFLTTHHPKPQANKLLFETEQLDLMSVIKASQTISKELELNSLIRNLFQIVIEQSAAQRGFLILNSEGKLTVEARAEMIGPNVVVETLQSEGLSQNTLSISIVQFVARTQQKVILNDTSSLMSFSDDDYLKHAQVKSILGLPIVRQGLLIGILYLENNLITNAFTSEKLVVLELLAAQAAISIENALFYNKQQESRLLLQSILDNTTAVIVIKNREGKYIFINRQFETLLHLSREKIIGKSDFDLFPKQEAEVFWQNDQKIIELDQPMEFEDSVTKNNKGHTYLSLKFPLHTAVGGLYGVCSISTDITERIRREDENMKLLVQVQNDLRTRDEFISIASHELKTPLTSLRLQIQMLAQILQNPGALVKLDSNVVASLNQNTEQQLLRLTKLVDDLLDLSRINLNSLELRLEHVNLSQLTHDVVEGFRTGFTRANCEVTLNIEANIEGIMDRLRIEQVITNLVANAIKFGQGKPIQISLKRAGRIGRVTIQDQGIGIREEDHERIFKRYERAVSIMQFGGLGLGLYISQEIMRAHHGIIKVDSKPNQGATFTVEIPLNHPAIEWH